MCCAGFCGRCVRMVRMGVEEITQALRGAGIHKGYPDARMRLAMKLAEVEDPEFTEVGLQRLLAEAELRGAKLPSAMVCKWLKDGGWMEIVGDPLPETPEEAGGNAFVPPDAWRDEYDVHRICCLALFDRRTAASIGKQVKKSEERVREIVREFGGKLTLQSRVDEWLDPAVAEKNLKAARARFLKSKRLIRVRGEGRGEELVPVDEKWAG